MRRRNLLNTGTTGVLSLSSTSGTANATASSKSFTVKWNDVALKDSSVVVSSDQSWATPTWTASSSTVKVTCTSNTDLTSTRSATITVTYQGVSATYTLTQSKGTLSLSSTTGNACGASNSTTFMIYVNGSTYTGTSTVSDNASWVTTSKSSGTVTVSYTANTGTSTSGSSRTATITVTVQGVSATYTLTQNYAMKITSLPYDGTVDGYKYVTLGGLKWCINNVGASSDGAVGNYYAWGETSTKSTYTKNNYKFGSSSSNLTKYNATDGLVNLELTDDAARVNMGGSWRMPTSSEATTLQSNTNYTSAVYGTTIGGLFIDKSNTSKYIFIPNGGAKINSSREWEDNGYVWHATRRTQSTMIYMADCIGISCTYDNTATHERNRGVPVRGVHA